MAAENGLMRPLRADSLKPRPSTQAVWEPRRPVQQAETQPEPVQEILAEPVAEEIPAVKEAPAVSPVPEPLPLPTEEETAEDKPSPPPYTESVCTFAPACSAQPEPSQPEAMEEESFDLDAVISAILTDEDDEDDDDDHPAGQDAMPTEEMPKPATVPLYEAPRPKPLHKGWIWLIAAAVIVAAAGYAARRLGWLS